jgi:hypothetical protein
VGEGARPGVPVSSRSGSLALGTCSSSPQPSAVIGAQGVINCHRPTARVATTAPPANTQQPDPTRRPRQSDDPRPRKAGLADRPARRRPTPPRRAGRHRRRPRRHVRALHQPVAQATAVVLVYRAISLWVPAPRQRRLAQAAQHARARASPGRDRALDQALAARPDEFPGADRL